MAEKAKRRTRSQRIGSKGEAMFSKWAQDNRLTSQKNAEDFGIDFFCQVMRPVGKDVEEVTGAILEVQVRATEGRTRKRIKFDREDAETALRTEAPYCLIGVDTALGEVYYRFLDEPFLDELHAFLRTKSRSRTFRIDTMGCGSDDFAKGLAQVTKPGFQQKLRWVKARLDINREVPGGRLKLWQSDSGGLGIVSAPWIESLFIVDPKHRDELARSFFDTGRLPIGKEGFALKEAVERIPRLVDGPVVMRGAIERETKLVVHHSGETASALFTVRRLGDELAYVSRTGLALTLSDARQEGDQWVHHMRTFLIGDSPAGLGTRPDDMAFLRLLKPGAKLGENDDKLIPVEYWRNLELLGPDIDAVERVLRHLDVGFDQCCLKDLTDEEFMLAIDLVRAALDDVPIPHFTPAFVLDDGGGDPTLDDNWIPAGYRAPIVANLKDRGLVVWFEGEGSVYRRPDELFAGFRPGPQRKWWYELRPERFEKSSRPELWLVRDWPAIQVMTPLDGIESHFVGGSKLVLGGDVWPLNDGSLTR